MCIKSPEQGATHAISLVITQPSESASSKPSLAVSAAVAHKQTNSTSNT